MKCRSHHRSGAPNSLFALWDIYLHFFESRMGCAASHMDAGDTYHGGRDTVEPIVTVARNTSIQMPPLAHAITSRASGASHTDIGDADQDGGIIAEGAVVPTVRAVRQALPLTHTIAACASTLPVGPREIPKLYMEAHSTITSAVETRLSSLSLIGLALSRVPSRVHADLPIEVELAAVGLCSSSSLAVSAARWISTHTLLSVRIETNDDSPPLELLVPFAVRPSGVCWAARALIHPASWAGAVSITLVSLSVAGQALPCDCLPASLQVGYSHAPATEGAVAEAARNGDVPALLAALEAGGSTEEADTVRRRNGAYQCEGVFILHFQHHVTRTPHPHPTSPSLFYRVTELLSGGPHREAASTLFARSWLQAQILPQRTRRGKGREESAACSARWERPRGALPLYVLGYWYARWDPRNSDRGARGERAWGVSHVASHSSGQEARG